MSATSAKSAGLGMMVKQFPSLVNGIPAFWLWQGHVFMAIQNDLRTERRMAGHLDGDVPPVGIYDMEGIVVNEDSFRFEVADDAAARSLNLPADGYRPP